MIFKTFMLTALLSICGATTSIQAQVMKTADLEKYAKEKYGEKWLDAAANLGRELNRYVVNITPIIKIDIKEGRVRVTYTVQNYDILKVEDGGWLGGLTDTDRDRNRSKDMYADGKRMKNDNTDRHLFDEQWEIVKRYPFVEKDAQKRTCAKALVMTHAYSNAIMDKVEEAIKNGLVGNEDDNW